MWSHDLVHFSVYYYLTVRRVVCAVACPSRIILVCVAIRRNSEANVYVSSKVYFAMLLAKWGRWHLFLRHSDQSSWMIFLSKKYCIKRHADLIHYWMSIRLLNIIHSRAQISVHIDFGIYSTSTIFQLKIGPTRKPRRSLEDNNMSF